jgi:type II secretory pathway component GspD/PulD (secretin)
MNGRLANRLAFGALVIVTALMPITALGQKADDISSRKVTLNMENGDIRAALKSLFKSVNANYTIDQAVRGEVTVSLTDVPFRTALESILKSTQSQKPLTYRVEDGVYIVAPKVEQITRMGGAESGDKTTEQPKQVMHMAKITLNFVDVETIVQAFGGFLLPSRFGGNIGGVIDGSGPLGAGLDLDKSKGILVGGANGR